MLATLALLSLSLAAQSPSNLPAGETPALATDGKEVVIPSRAGGAVRRYTAFDPDVLFLEDFRGRWYRAKLSGPCFNDGAYRRQLVFRNRGGTEAVDRFSSVVRNDGRACGIQSLVRVKALPTGRKSIAGI